MSDITYNFYQVLLLGGSLVPPLSAQHSNSSVVVFRGFLGLVLYPRSVHFGACAELLEYRRWWRFFLRRALSISRQINAGSYEWNVLCGCSERNPVEKGFCTFLGRFVFDKQATVLPCIFLNKKKYFYEPSVIHMCM